MSQPVEEYPSNTVMTRQPDSSSDSSGSFGPVFAVLAVIVVVSAVACVLGRICSKRKHRAKEAAHHPTKAGKQGLPKEWQKPSFKKEGDIELGFDKKAPFSKGPAKNGGGGGGGGKTKAPPRQPEFRFSDN